MLFESRWKILLEKFLSASSYLNQTLYSSRYSWACTFTSKVFTAEIQTTSCIEGNSGLCDLVKTLDSQLEKEAEWNHFFEYQTLSSCIGIASVSSEILPAVDYILLEYLTLQILSIERIEMAQYLYFDAILVDLTIIGLDDENENISDRFTEDVYNTKQILLKLMISKENVIFANSDTSEAQQGQKTPLIPQSFILKHFINQKKRLLIQNEEPKDSDDSENSSRLQQKSLVVSRIHVEAVVRLGTIVRDVKRKLVNLML
ncbi:36422_t:CDS:2, partial [Racocetra persica]